MGWQWHQLDYMQIICTSILQLSNVLHYNNASAYISGIRHGIILIVHREPNV